MIVYRRLYGELVGEKLTNKLAAAGTVEAG